MRTLIRAVTTRYGIAGLLVLGVLIVVGVARLIGGEVERPGSAAGGADPYASISVGPDDGLVEVDPEDPVTEPSDDTSLPPGLADPRPVAEAFATAWADHSGVSPETWRERLAEYATESLMDRLADTDPSTVPTDSITGEPTLTSVRGDRFAEVSIEADGGVLVLGLMLQDGEWAVDSIDWRRE